jgi:hypothetical protein
MKNAPVLLVILLSSIFNRYRLKFFKPCNTHRISFKLEGVPTDVEFTPLMLAPARAHLI